MKKLIYILLILPVLVAMKCEKEEPDITIPVIEPIEKESLFGYWEGETVNVKLYHNKEKVAESTFPLPKYDSDFLRALRITDSTFVFHFPNSDNDFYFNSFNTKERSVYVNPEGEEYKLMEVNEVSEDEMICTFYEDYVDNSSGSTVYKERILRYTLILAQ